MVINSGEKSPFEIRDSTGKEFKEIYDNQGRLLFKNWNEIQGSPPITFRGYGKDLIECLIYGNTVQNGTPSPEVPVDVVGCGVRTRNIANLYGVNKETLNLTFTKGNNMTIKINGTKTDGANVVVVSSPNIMLHAGTYTVKIKMIGGSITNITGGVVFGINKSTYGMRTTPQVNTIGQIGTRTFALNEDTLLTSLDITPSYGDAGAVFNDAEFECWLYSGSDDIPYEPYGYKLPLTVNGTEYPIYLGQVETTRNVKKLVLTGEENYTKDSTGDYMYWTSENVAHLIQSDCFCSHLMSIRDYPRYQIGINTYETNGVIYFNFGADVMGMQPSGNTVAGLKEYLAAQYAAGTPVTVWYVLAAPETGIVNEPIQKIGDYSDELSIADIPAINGINTISADTTVQPSEIYIKGKIKPAT